MEVIYEDSGALGISFPDVEAMEMPLGVDSFVMPVQTHTVNVGVVTEPCMEFPETDALVTTLPGVAVGVRTADCVPVLLHDPVNGVVAAVHAGWKGTIGGIAAGTIKTMCECGAETDCIRAVFGPAVCGLCYETSPEMASAFRDAGLEESLVFSDQPDPAGLRDYGAYTVRIDLKTANRIIMEQAGIKEENISDCGICTRHSGGWPSWRLNPGTAKRLASIIFLR